MGAAESAVHGHEESSSETVHHASLSKRTPSCSYDENQIECQSGAATCAMMVQRFQLEPGLLNLLVECPEFRTDTALTQVTDEDRREDALTMMSDLGYFRCKDPGHPPGHVYYEGYFHALHNGGDGAVLCMNPRYGEDMMKPAAPPALRAFLQVLREKNSARLTKALADAGLADVIRLESLFADVASQHHHGTAVNISPASMVGWHTDGLNSMLHLAISLGGRRVLHVQDAHGTCSSFELVAGDVYLAAPAFFEHAVEYPACDAAHRVLALQCRTHLLEEDQRALAAVRGAQKAAGRGDTIQRAIASLLADGPLRMPTLVEVQTRLQE